MCDDTDESPAQQESVAMAPEGVVFLLGGATEVCRHLPRAWLVVSPGESLGPELDRRDGGVSDVVPLLGASRFETLLGGSMWRSSGARRCFW